MLSLWESTLSGLTVFMHWQTYVALMEYLILFLVPISIFGFLGERFNSYISLVYFLLFPAVRMWALFVFVVTVSPVVLGLSDHFLWSTPWLILAKAPFFAFKTIGILIIASATVGFIPIVGNLGALHSLVLGGYTLASTIALFDVANSGAIVSRLNFFPSFWFCLGLLAISSVLIWLVSMLFSMVLVAFENNEIVSGETVMFLVGSVLGFIPVFIYGAWLGIQL